MTTPATLIDIGTLIESIPGVYGGRPRLARSGLPIIQLVAEVRAGRTIQEIISAYGLDEESGYAGLAFYLANKAALDQELDERNELGSRLYGEWKREHPDWSGELKARNRLE